MGIFVGGQEIKDMRIGTKPIIAAYSGSVKVWPPEPILEVTPQYIWLMPSNNFTDDVSVVSNIDWIVK